MAQRVEIESHLAAGLPADPRQDYGPNGLQVEGRAEVGRVPSGANARLALLQVAVAAPAYAALVQPGLLWRGLDGRIAGWMRQRLAVRLGRQPRFFKIGRPT